MKQYNLTIKSHMDGLPLSVLIVEPDIPPKAIVQLLHGMSEHKERYLDFCEYLAKQGFVSVIHDHRGHGKSVYNKNDLGYMYKNGAKSLVEDANQLSRMARKKYPELPIFLFGHSMGSLVARAYAKKYDRILDGLILSGSPSNNKASRLALIMAKVGGKLLGDRTKGNYLQKMSVGSFNANIKNPISPNAWICTNEDVVKAYDASDLCGFVFTLNGFENLFKLLINVYDKHNWSVNNRKLPIWFISGAEDPCMKNQEEFLKAVNLMKSKGYQNVSYSIYKGMRHEILNETDHIKVYQEIAAKLEVWLNRENYGAIRRK